MYHITNIVYPFNKNTILTLSGKHINVKLVKILKINEHKLETERRLSILTGHR